MGYPLLLYLVFYVFFRSVLGVFMGEKASTVLSAILCFLVGLVLLFPVYLCRTYAQESGDIAQTLRSPSRMERAAALKRAFNQGVDIAVLPDYRRFLESPYVPERYWAVRSLGNSRRPETYTDILAMLDDPQVNVACAAYYALSRRRNPKGVAEIVKRIKESDQWYAQWYAYRALKDLGWKQKKSP